MRILIIKTSALGDIVQCYPVLDYLREILPEARIDWVVEKRAAPLITAHPLVDNAIVIDSRAWKKDPFSKKTWQEIGRLKKYLKVTPYDVVFDLQGNLKSSLIVVMTRTSEKVGFKKPAEFPNRFFTTKKFQPPSGKNIREDYLFLVQSFFNNFSFPKKREVLLDLTDDEKRRLNEILSSLPSKNRTLVAPSSIWPNKEVSDEKLLSYLEELLPDREEILRRSGIFPRFFCLGLNPPLKGRDCGRHPVQKGPSFFLFIAANEREKKRALFLMQNFKDHSCLLENLSFPLLQHLMASVDQVIAMDSFPLHLAATTATPTFGFFGPTLASKYAPLGESSCYFQGSCPFRKVFDKRCPLMRSCKEGGCLKKLP